MMPTVAAFPYVWAWRDNPPKRCFDRDRKGEPCRVLTRGKMNSCLVEFPDGHRVITSRSGIRKRTPEVV
jgi:hypothetical protein